MPRSLRDPEGRRSILDRLAALTPEHPRTWGRMEPAQLLPHLAGGLRMALGERKAEGSPSGWLPAPVWRYLAIHVLPWPEGKIQSPPGAFNTPSLGWQRDREVVVELIERFAATPPEKLGGAHPTFGRMRALDWDVLQYRHLDHHLRQFGV
ncbi:MAG TPA: hypothetical protein VGA78_02630 [Gemmatimonadales bacterium]